MKNLKLYLQLSLPIFILVSSLPSCERAKVENAQLVLKLPASSVETSNSIENSNSGEKPISQKVSTLADETSWNTSLIPTNISQIDCYAVFVGGAESLMRTNSCEIGPTAGLASNKKIFFGPHVGFIKAGGEISIEVPSGQRDIYLMGLKENPGSGACKSFAGTNPDKSNLSQPMIIGVNQVVLNPGTQVVEIMQSLDSNQLLQSCTFMQSESGGNGTGTTPEAFPFGDGRDGDLTFTVTSTDFSTHLYNASGTYTPNASFANAPGSSKVFNATRRVVNISADVKTLTTATAFSSYEFEAGDEILWHVIAANGAVTPDSACGSGLPRGKWGFGKISTTGTTTITMEQSMGPITPDNTNISATPLATQFCLIQVIRVPNFNLMTFNSPGTRTITSSTFDWSTGFGGLLVFKTKKLEIGVSTSLEAKMESKGFLHATSYEATGLSGVSLLAAQFMPSQGGGGGGNAGAGGYGNSSYTTLTRGGEAHTALCGSSYCFPHTGKVFYGGSGAGMSALPGGKGGGVIMILAEEISGGGTLDLYANGGHSNFDKAGGGAGGSIYVRSKFVTNTASKTARVEG
ncbi:MAG TPA: hypothetical protein PLJ21_09740, partial [Pseudobdellovibrionaceae bacterium]|nr:hypothetical protein [Pseudobdellovibrionaceae bacterium]